jgi:hypothetical protein
MVANAKPPIVVERVQTGVRMEKRLLKVLKGLAELKDLTLGDCWKESSCMPSRARPLFLPRPSRRLKSCATFTD